MSGFEGAEPRPEVVIGAALYLMSAYLRAPCPRLAGCVVRHLECIATHARVDPVLRDLCAGLHEQWRCAAARIGTAQGALH